MKNNKPSFLLAAYCLVCVIFLAGCATAPKKTGLSSVDLAGVKYLSLVLLCEAKGINIDYDTFTRTAALTGDLHKINLAAGDNLVLVDGEPLHLDHPVKIYQGSMFVPYKFKEEVFDALFKEPYPGQEACLSLLKIKKVVVDAGHGGRDPGAIGRNGSREKDINLDIAKRLNRLLVSEGVEVALTRGTDNFVALPDRVEIANDSGADLFISIHSNANHVKSLHGFEVYYVAGGINEDAKRAYSAAKNAALDLDLACIDNPSQDLKAILWDLIYTSCRAESVKLALFLCRAVGSEMDVKVLGTKDAPFEVLRGVRMPAVLVEVGFLSNSNEERMLRNSYFRRKMAEGLLKGIKDYARDSALTEIASR